MAEVALHQVVKKFGEVEAVRAIDLDIPDNEFVVLVGPSGCGKSTTLRMIAGLEEVTSGNISIGGEVVNDLPPKDRDIAMVFQNYALYPHMTAYENMAFGLKLRKFPKDEIRQRVEHAARILDITELLDRRPRHCQAASASASPWGARSCAIQRSFCSTNLCRTSTPSCACRCARKSNACIRRCKTTTVYVTHDQVEAMTLADRVVVMNDGRIEQIGTPQELYHHPRTRFVAGFIGSPAMNFIPCRLEQNGAGMRVRISDTIAFPVPASNEGALPGDGRKRRHAGVTAGAHHRTASQWARGRPRFHGDARRCRAHGHGNHGVFHGQRHRDLRPGRTEQRRRCRSPMRLFANIDHMHLIDPASGLVI